MLQFQVPDMTCQHCEASIKRAIKEIDEQASIEVDLTTHTVKVGSTQQTQAIETAIREAGFSPVSI